MEQILDASATVFARLGYEKATTIAIAAEAGISPGSLYQYFPNKKAIAQALADRFVTRMRSAHQDAFDAIDFAGIGLDEVLDRIVDPIVAFNIAHPGFKALFARPDMPEGLADAARPIQAALLGRIEAMIGARAPGLPDTERQVTARVAVQIFQALTPLVIAVEKGEREAMVGELKKALRGYLGPVIG